MSKRLGIVFCLFCCTHVFGRTRQDILLDNGWRTTEDDSPSSKYTGFEKNSFDASHWLAVAVPHNWEGYFNDRQVVNGSRHGSAWYRKIFSVDRRESSERIFLLFEGVGSYATVWINGHLVGHHAGGLTSFTFDVTDAVQFNTPNVLAVRADNPAHIHDLPWVSGDDSDIRGCCEGSEPFGIFRPVHLIRTAAIRIEPFGVNIWNGTDVSEQSAKLHIRTEIKNYDTAARKVTLVSRLTDDAGHVVAEVKTPCNLNPGSSQQVEQDLPPIINPHLWSLDHPYLYSLQSTIDASGEAVDGVETKYGIRWIEWPLDAKDGTQFLLNGKPVFIRGTAEYEHLLGSSQAFTPELIRARVRQMEAAGFNAFRDAHYPHNLRYQSYWETDGLLWWPQFSAHIWFDNPAFRSNFKQLLSDWIKERRNNPSVVLWGLQNESALPTAFAEECTRTIHDLDPTSSSQRKIVTCNFGSGTDWNVPQNWSGTYGGDPNAYAQDLQKQKLVGEYGAWRSIDFHTEGGYQKNGPLSENRMAALLETKLRLAETVRDKVFGQFQWIFETHENPGRAEGKNGEQMSDGIRNLDRIGPANNKGLLTLWGEPVDAFYMYRSNQASKQTQPMVYIVSHTWPDRWQRPGKESGIIVYSNCDEVELFNDVRNISLGKKKHEEGATHFQWDDVPIQYNVLYAEGFVNGKVVATDAIVLNNLPKAPHWDELVAKKLNITKPEPGQHYLYRVNCGGPEYIDSNGSRWSADHDFTPDDSWGSTSWAAEFSNLDPEFGSKRKTYDPIQGTRDAPLFQSFRYGREKLRYVFSVPPGEYRIELYFVEPWYGRGSIDAAGWRLFDVAVNGKTVISNLDIWKEAGFDTALKKVVTGTAVDGKLEISFPRIASYQAVISAIAISTARRVSMPSPPVNAVVQNLKVNDTRNARDYSVQSYLDNGDVQYQDSSARFSQIPYHLLDSFWIETANESRRFRGSEVLQFRVASAADVYVAHDTRVATPAWLAGWEDTKEQCSNDNSEETAFELYRKRFSAGSIVVLGENGAATAGLANMYSVFVTRHVSPQSQPTAEQVSSKIYEAESAHLSHAIVSTGIKGYSGSGYVTLNGPGESSIQWKISVGVGNTYSLVFRYLSNAANTINGTVTIQDSNGTILDKHAVRFSTTNGDSNWHRLTTTTSVSINAGTYNVTLAFDDANGLLIDSLTVQ